jgi:hypothetical protein
MQRMAAYGQPKRTDDTDLVKIPASLFERQSAIDLTPAFAA